LSIGIYLLFMVWSDRIWLHRHIHKDGEEHLHIWFGKEHHHDIQNSASAFTIGALMGMGDVRGMLILGVIESQSVDFTMVLAFTLGVMVVFVSFGIVILYINKNLLHSKRNVKRIFAVAGVASVVVGTQMLIG